jgi:hypothetical protein
MDWILFGIIVVVAIAVFVISQAVMIVMLLQENQRIGEELEKNQPPF